MDFAKDLLYLSELKKSELKRTISKVPAHHFFTRTFFPPLSFSLDVGSGEGGGDEKGRWRGGESAELWDMRHMTHLSLFSILRQINPEILAKYLRPWICPCAMGMGRDNVMPLTGEFPFSPPGGPLAGGTRHVQPFQGGVLMTENSVGPAMSPSSRALSRTHGTGGILAAGLREGVQV